MTCPRCQSPTPEGARFCEECGVPLELRCPSCGRPRGELGMRPLVAHCLGKINWRIGKREQAREHLTTATTMYREMDMRFWLEQAETIMGALP